MSHATVRISSSAHDELRLLSTRTGKPMQAVVEAAIELYRRQVFLDEVNAGYAALRQDPAAWSEIAEERSEWDATLADGLGED